MPWWSWIVIWVVLALALVAMLVLSAVRLFRKAMRVLEALGDLGEKVALLQDAVEDLQPGTPANAVLTGYPAVAAQREAFQERRLAIKAERRQAAVLRGKLLTQSVPTRRT